MPIEGGNAVRIWEKPGASEISPDGKWVRIADQQKVMLIPATGGEAVKIADPDPKWGPPIQWTPDGGAFLYVTSINGVPNVWQRNMDGGETKQLTRFESKLIWSAAMSRDGKELAVVRYSITNDVVLIKDLNVK
jgi:Tol biopolymer transport system component